VTAVVLMGVVVSTVVARVVVLVEMAQAVQLGATATVVATFTYQCGLLSWSLDLQFWCAVFRMFFL